MRNKDNLRVSLLFSTLIMSSIVFVSLSCSLRGESKTQVEEESSLLEARVDTRSIQVKEAQRRIENLNKQRLSNQAEFDQKMAELRQQAATNAQQIAQVTRWTNYIHGRPLNEGLINGVEALKQLQIEAKGEEAIWNSYWHLKMEQKDLLAQLELSEANVERLRETYRVLEVLREHAFKTKLSFEALLALEEAAHFEDRKESVYEEDYKAAYKNNWRVGKEVALYLFGFKWLWGAFMGYGVNTDYSQQLKDLEELRATLPASRNFRARQRELLTQEYQQNMAQLKLAFDEEAAKQTNLNNKNGILELKARIVDVYSNYQRAFEEFIKEEKIYREAIIGGLKEPLKPRIIESWTLGGFDISGEVLAGYKNQIGRVLPPFVVDGSIRPNPKWDKRVQRRVGGGWADELRSFRRANYEEAMDSLEVAKLRFINTYRELSEFDSIREEDKHLKSEEEAFREPNSLFPKIKFFLELAQRERSVIESGVEQHQRMVAQFEEENRSVLASFREELHSRGQMSNELEALKAQAQEMVLEIQELTQKHEASTPFVKKLATLREKALETRDAFLALLNQERAEEEAKEWVRLRQEDLNNVSTHNWRWAKEITLYTLGFKWLWGIFSGFSPTTSYAEEAAALAKEKERLQQVRLQQIDKLRQLRASYEHLFSETLNALEAARAEAPLPSFEVMLSSFGLSFTKAFDELELAKNRLEIAFNLYRSSMENGINSLSDFYQHEYADVEDINRARSSGSKTKPSLAADWVLLERERESEQYYKAKETFGNQLNSFINVFAGELETIFSKISSILETQRSRLDSNTKKLIHLQNISLQLHRMLGLEVPLDEALVPPSQTPKEEIELN